MQLKFKVGDRVEVIGALAKVFAGENGTILEIIQARPDPQQTIYRIAFNEKHIRMTGLYLKLVSLNSTRQAMCSSF
jgi:hypothetical protein